METMQAGEALRDGAGQTRGGDVIIAAEQRLSMHLVADHGQDHGVPGGDRGVPPDPAR
jgi:hypothetical protein